MSHRDEDNVSMLSPRVLCSHRHMFAVVASH